ncbi:MAG: M23 family metallopeptidase [Patescibacteria group bacterium]|jgi:murein DD-endopeptidase MepM/ murein hydrolase activator NlpD
MLKEESLQEDIRSFITFIGTYTRKKTVRAAVLFEKAKDALVTLLVAKRGKYQHSFLNTSFFLLVIAIWFAGPIIAENNPLLGQNTTSTATSSSVVSVYSLGSGDMVTTKVSQKPRDSIVYYKIQSGDTLAGIAQKFDISVNTIKWANDLKSETINVNDTLKILPVSGIAHKVTSGDTIYSIAKKYNTDAQKVVNFPFNEFADLDTFAITPGQILFVPDGTPQQAQPLVQPSYAQYFAGQGGTGSFIWPTTGMITQYPIWYHMALDIANPSSPPVLAADSGTVSFAGCINWGYGCHVIINHQSGYQSLYGHLSQVAVSDGQAVTKGQQIGNMGSTGRSTGTHLHFEIRQGGALLSPLSFLQ